MALKCGSLPRDAGDLAGLVMVTMEAYRNHYRLSFFRMVPSIADGPYDLPFRQNGSQLHLDDQLLDACCHLANMIENIDKLCACRMSL